MEELAVLNVETKPTKYIFVIYFNRLIFPIFYVLYKRIYQPGALNINFEQIPSTDLSSFCGSQPNMV